jgi:hypothetical protein
LSFALPSTRMTAFNSKIEKEKKKTRKSIPFVSFFLLVFTTSFASYACLPFR